MARAPPKRSLKRSATPKRIRIWTPKLLEDVFVKMKKVVPLLLLALSLASAFAPPRAAAPRRAAARRPRARAARLRAAPDYLQALDDGDDGARDGAARAAPPPAAAAAPAAAAPAEGDEPAPPIPSVAQIRAFALPALALWLGGPILSLIDTSAVGLSARAGDGARAIASLGPGTTFCDGARARALL